MLFPGDWTIPKVQFSDDHVTMLFNNLTLAISLSFNFSQPKKPPSGISSLLYSLFWILPGPFETSIITESQDIQRVIHVQRNTLARTWLAPASCSATPLFHLQRWVQFSSSSCAVCHPSHPHIIPRPFSRSLISRTCHAGV